MMIVYCSPEPKRRATLPNLPSHASPTGNDPANNNRPTRRQASLPDRLPNTSPTNNHLANNPSPQQGTLLPPYARSPVV